MKPIPTTSASSAKSLDCGRATEGTVRTRGRTGGDDRGALGANTSNTSTYATFAAMKLSMIVVITSLASVYAFSAPESRPRSRRRRHPRGLRRRSARRPRPALPGAAPPRARSVRSQDPDDQLALCPDVEQPGAERDRDGESPVKISSVVSESVSPSERLNGVQAGSMSPVHRPRTGTRARR